MKEVIELPTEYGNLEVFAHSIGSEECVVAINREFEGEPFVRIHSSCLFSEAFHSNDCDCAIQLDSALKYISLNGGVIIYLYQEGRGIGIVDKIKAIELEQKKGLHTVEAFKALGHEPDPRDYDLAISVLKVLGYEKVALGTNNPKKIKLLEDAGISVVKRVQLQIQPNDITKKYIKGKTKVLGHHEND